MWYTCVVFMRSLIDDFFCVIRTVTVLYGCDAHVINFLPLIKKLKQTLGPTKTETNVNIVGSTYKYKFIYT